MGPQLLLGDHLEYNMDARRGTLTNAYMRGSDVLVTGGRIEIEEIDVRDRDGVEQAYNFEVRDGSITACEYTIPHYHLTADFLRVVPNVRVWLYSAAYRITKLPIFYLPYLTRSLRKEPFAYVFEPGYDSDKGFILLNRFHFHYQDLIHPWARATVYADYFSRMGPGIGAKWTYLRQPEADSFVHGYYINQRDDFDETDDSRTDSTEGSRGKIYFQHFQRLNSQWTLTGKGRRLSDPDFDEDYRDEEIIRGFQSEELRSDRDAFINLARTSTNSNFRIIHKERLDDFNLLEFQEDERSPEVVYDSKRRPFDGTDIYHHFKFSAGHYKSHQTTDTGNVDRVITTAGTDADIEQEFSRGDFEAELNRPFNVGALTVIPFAGYEGTAYSDATRKTRVWEHRGEDQLDPVQVLVEEYDGLFRHVLSGGMEFVTRRALRFDDPEKNVERRLLFEPSVTFLGQLPSEDLEDLNPDSEHPASPASDLIVRSRDLADDLRPGFPFIDEVDSIRDEFLGLELRLESRYQTRKTGGASRDVVRAAVSTAVDFTETDDGDEEFSPVLAELFVSPFEWLHFSNYLEYEPKGSFIRSARSALRWEPAFPLAVEIAYSRFQFTEDADKQEELAVALDFPVSQRYAFTYEERFDLDDSETRLRRIGVVRDFHDWILTVGVSQRNRESRQKSFGTYFTLTLKTPRALEGALPFERAVSVDDEEGALPPRRASGT
jgi:hypothetical protein